jgi:DNA-binding transcriptional LysR family regulator
VACLFEEQVTPYQDDEVVVVVAADHPLAAGGTISKDGLYGLKFVSLHNSSTLQGIRSQLEAADICWTGLQVNMVPSSLQLCQSFCFSILFFHDGSPSAFQF